MRVALVFGVGAAVLLGACGGSASDDADPEATPSPGPTTVVAPVTTTAPAPDLEAADDAPGDEPPDDTGGSPASVPGPSSSDLTDLDPGTAVVVVDGVEFRFARGDSMFDVCELSPDFDLVAVEMDLADGSADGGRHLVFNDDSAGRFLTIGVPPDTGFIAGAGEEIDRYAQFDVDSPPLGPTEVGDGTAVGTSDMVDVFSGETVQASFAIRCE